MPDLDKLLDTLVADVTAGTRAPGAPRAIKLARRRRWETAAAGGVALAVVSTIAAMSLATGHRSAEPPHPADQPGLSTSLVAPTTLLEVRELGFHVEPGPDVVPTGGWALGPDSQSTDVKVFGDSGPTDLQVTVYTKHSDPRSGDLVFRLENVKREEPAAALFAVPADYTVRGPDAHWRDKVGRADK